MKLEKKDDFKEIFPSREKKKKILQFLTNSFMLNVSLILPTFPTGNPLPLAISIEMITMWRDKRMGENQFTKYLQNRMTLNWKRS